MPSVVRYAPRLGSRRAARRRSRSRRSGRRSGRRWWRRRRHRGCQRRRPPSGALQPRRTNVPATNVPASSVTAHRRLCPPMAQVPLVDHGLMKPSLFDAHLHIIDPRFPLVPNQGWLPDPFTTEDYLARVAALGVVGGAVVSGSFQGFDQTYLREALRRLGPGFVGVTQLPATASDAEILDLAAAGVRA